MNERPEPLPPDEPESADDLRVRQLMTSRAPRAAPPGIEAKVLRKVGRRKLVVRATSVTAVVAALTAVGFVSRGPLRQPPRRDSMAAADPVPARPIDVASQTTFQETDMVAVAASPPVVSLALVSRDQLGLLECLKTLTEESR